MAKLSISISDELLERLDKVMTAAGVINRSQWFEERLRVGFAMYLTELNKKEGVSNGLLQTSGKI